MRIDAIQIPNLPLTLHSHSNSTMSSAQILRPFARALQRPIARPTSYAAFSTKSAKVVAPFTPSANTLLLQARTQKSSEKAVEPAQKMSKLVWNIRGTSIDAELIDVTRISSKLLCPSSSHSTSSTRLPWPSSSSQPSSTYSPSTFSHRECELWPHACSLASYK
jgi:hypothetical protein